MRHRRRTIAAAYALVALVLAGCSAAVADGVPAAVQPDASVPEAETDLPEVEPFVRAPGPLEEIMAAIGDPFVLPPDLPRAERQARFVQTIREFDASVARCMHEQGFDFEVNPDPAFESERLVRDDVVPGTREFVLEFGLGITNPAFYMITEGSDVDPNADLLAEMSDAHRDAWTEALHGDPSDPDNPGCWTASQYVWTGMTAAPDHEFAGLADEVNAFFLRIGNTHDHGGSPVEEEWSACMVALGHPAHHNPTALRHAMENEYGTRPADLAEFARREFAAAADSLRCEVQVDLHLRSQDWQHERQAEFVEQHRAELEAWLAHAQAQRGEVEAEAEA